MCFRAKVGCYEGPLGGWCWVGWSSLCVHSYKWIGKDNFFLISLLVNGVSTIIWFVGI